MRALGAKQAELEEEWAGKLEREKAVWQTALLEEETKRTSEKLALIQRAEQQDAKLIAAQAVRVRGQGLGVRVRVRRLTLTRAALIPRKSLRMPKGRRIDYAGSLRCTPPPICT